MMVKIVFVSLFLFFQHSYALKEISAEEYNRFPPLRHIDRFSQCLRDKDGAYCTSRFEFVAEGPNELYDAMSNFSTRRHLNFRRGVYGYCITRGCKEFHTGNSDAALETAMGACLNKTLEREYGLQAKLHQTTCHRHNEQKYTVTWLDQGAKVLLFTFVALAIVGTFYDLLVTDKNPKGYLMCFSLPANWARLTAPWPQEGRMARLIGLNGIRAITSLLVILVHILVILDVCDDMYRLQELYEMPSFHILIQAPIIMQTFIFLSGLLLAYNVQMSDEKNLKTRRSLPKSILLRFLRLAPVTYAVSLFTLTWYKFVPYGPEWQNLINREVIDCKKNWYSIFFFYQNYVDNMECNIHLWSTAADLHLQIIGVTVLLFSRTRRARVIALWALLLLGMALPALEIYAKDLDGNFLIRPQTILIENLTTGKTINNLHKPTHTNFPNFVIGMATGLLLYQWQKDQIDFTKYRKYSILYWLLFPVLMSLPFSNVFLLWGEDNRGSLLTRMLFGAFQKPAWGLTMALITVGMVFQIEKVGAYRRVLEWDGWAPLARLSFCSYSVHMPLIHIVGGSTATLFNGSVLHLLLIAAGFIVMSLIFATVLWLLVEAPCANLVGKMFPEKRSVLLATVDKKE